MAASVWWQRPEADSQSDRISAIAKIPTAPFCEMRSLGSIRCPVSRCEILECSTMPRMRRNDVSTDCFILPHPAPDPAALTNQSPATSTTPVGEPLPSNGPVRGRLPIVGVGASAGGLEALERMFQNIATDSGAAYVVIQHLSPDFESHMQQLLSRVTPLKVQVATDNQEVLADEVFLIPPGQDLTIRGRRLHLSPRSESNNYTRPIDAFFTSLAIAAGADAAAVVLSGTGSDGSRGIVDVDQAGGMVIAQSPGSCAFDAMPVNAAATGCVDVVVAPEQIGGVLRHHFDPEGHPQPDLNLIDPPGMAGRTVNGHQTVGVASRSRWTMPPRTSISGSPVAGAAKASDTPPTDPVASNRGSMNDVFAALRTAHQIDFELYKVGTIGRRLERRMQRTGAASLQTYARRLREDPAEVNELYRDLLINVTQFFRDPDAFDQLRRVADEMVDQWIQRVVDQGTASVPPPNRGGPARGGLARPNRDGSGPATIRVWICGCATGEEAYSVAIVFAEALDARRDPAGCVAAGVPPLPAELSAAIDWRSHSPPLKVFATDAHRDSLQTAGAGIYDAGSMLGVSPGRREMFFATRRDQFVVRPELRRLVVFAPHDLTRDPPFTQIDLVTCRNVLIYLRAEPQDRALRSFHFALRPGGCLWLGPSESLGMLKSHFGAIDPHWKFFRRQMSVLPGGPQRGLIARPAGRPDDDSQPADDWPVQTPTRSPLVLVPRTGERPGSESSLPIETITAPAATAAPIANDLLLSVYDRLLNQHMPPSILTDDSLQVLHIFPGCETLLRYPPGRPTRYLPDLLDPQLREPLLAASLQCKQRQVPVTVDGLPAADTAMLVEPVPLPGREGTTLLVRWFGPDTKDTDRRAGAAESAAPPRPDAEPLQPAGRNELLEAELEHTRQNLQSTIEELETSNEELQATNEEMVVSNEELQSTNEELHGVNEELYTVNAEHQRRVQELDEANQDINHLLAATRVGVLFLDRNLLIRRFTPETSRLFDLTDQDIGRRIDLFCSGPDHEPMLRLIREVISRLEGGEAEVVLEDQTYLIRAVPMLHETEIRGVVVALINIQPLKAAQAQTLRFKFMCDQAVEPHGLLDQRGRVTYGNAAMAAALGYEIEQLAGLRIDWVDPAMTADQMAIRLKGSDSTPGDAPKIVESTFRRLDGTTFPVEVSYSPVTLDGQPCLYLTARDVTRRHQRDAEMQLLQKCVATVTNGIVISDPTLPDNPITFVNNGFVEMTGYAMEDILGRNCRFLQGKDTSRDAVRVIRRAIKQERPCRTLMVNYRKDGTAFWNDLYITPVRDHDGRVTHFVGVQNDVTERVRIGESARSSEQTIRLLLDSTAEAILGIDTNNLCMFLNASAVKALGLRDADDAISHDVERLLQLGSDPTHHYPRGKSPISQAIRQGISVNRCDEVFRRSDGTCFPVEYWCHPIIQDDRTVGAVITFVDISDRLQTQQQLRDARDQANQANQAKSRFLANMSHELRTPLSAILGFTDILQQEVSDESINEKLTTIRRNGDYLLRLLGDVLDLSRIEAGKFNFKKISVELEELLHDVHDTMQMRSNDYDNTLRFHYPEPLPPIVQTDPSRLRQVLINLIANGLKFAPGGQVDLWVRVDDSGDPPQLVFEVVDNGIGISESQQKQLFKPFTQADESIAIRFGGTGLGLSITQRLVEALGGSVSVDSELERGSRFTVRLPLLVRSSRIRFATAQQNIDDGENEPESDDEAEATLPEGLRVLIADDIRDVRFIAQHFLVKAGCEIETAENGQQAIDRIRQAQDANHPFDVVLMDMQMPVLDGEAAVQQLRAEGNDLSVIALTADAMRGTRRRLLEAGFDEYLSKPLRPARLIQVIARLVRPEEQPT